MTEIKKHNDFITVQFKSGSRLEIGEKTLICGNEFGSVVKHFMEMTKVMEVPSFLSLNSPRYYEAGLIKLDLKDVDFILLTTKYNA